MDAAGLMGLVAYNISSTRTQEILGNIDSMNEITAVVTYGANTLESSRPTLRHIVGTTSKANPSNDSTSKTFEYPEAGTFFPIPSHSDFSSAPAAVSHTRTLQFLKPFTGGPWFDLEAIWDEHTKFEFGERAVEKTMGTMVQEPYVNHIPTMTGGIGRDRLTNFYRHHFIFNNPDDTALELVSRTVGIDRVIDEFLFKFTHDRVIDWL